MWYFRRLWVKELRLAEKQEAKKWYSSVACDYFNGNTVLSMKNGEKKLPAISDRAVCEIVIYGLAEVRWDSVIDKDSVEGPRRKPRRYAVHREVWGMKDRRKRKDRSKGKARAKKEGE